MCAPSSSEFLVFCSFLDQYTAAVQVTDPGAAMLADRDPVPDPEGGGGWVGRDRYSY
jgi:hypothetical protein